MKVEGLGLSETLSKPRPQGNPALPGLPAVLVQPDLRGLVLEHRLEAVGPVLEQVVQLVLDVVGGLGGAEQGTEGRP
jgi:hypothetical protein